jgi:hypothetical protein
VGGVTEAGIIVYGIREWGARSEYDRSQLVANLPTMRLILTGFGIACVIVGCRQLLVLGTLVAGAGLLMQVIADVLSDLPPGAAAARKADSSQLDNGGVNQTLPWALSRRLCHHRRLLRHRNVPERR